MEARNTEVYLGTDRKDAYRLRVDPTLISVFDVTTK